MGTHPIFESDFDCLTECHELVPGNASKLTTVWPSVKPSVPPKLNWPHLPMLYPLLPTPSPEPTSKLNVATNTMARNLKLATKPLLDLKANSTQWATKSKPNCPDQPMLSKSLAFPDGPPPPLKSQAANWSKVLPTLNLVLLSHHTGTNVK